jgi:hypothetical protein
MKPDDAIPGDLLTRSTTFCLMLCYITAVAVALCYIIKEMRRGWGGLLEDAISVFFMKLRQKPLN